MAIKIGRAGKLASDDNGFVVAKLDSLKIKEQVNTKGKIQQQIEWVFKVPTTKGKDADKYMWTGVDVNSIKNYIPTNLETGELDTENPQYNMLTQFLLSIGAVTEKQVLSNEDIDLDVESFIGKKFQFKQIPQKLKPQFGDIDISSIKFVEA